MKSMYDVNKDSFAIDEAKDKLLMEAMNTCWQAIAPDAFESEEETLTRDDVLELVFDADRLADYTTIEIAAYGVWLSRYDEVYFEKIAKKAFPYDTFGY